MTIQILPARLANQIAAGEVVERPASVVKELVENSLDAGATKIRIDIEKGGAKRIRIIDNGKGIAKDELTLALSRHATSKIKDLDDLEAIASLGFRGEALASISSVSRLTLSSKPQDQAQAWQASAEGRDMAVTVQPTAHPEGTTIDVVDLFFNTPARRKFLRTDKTEFSHIEEVIKRIALAYFNVSFILTHNGKQLRHYRQCQSEEQYEKRIGQVCGQPFLANAIKVKSEHHDIKLSGWIGDPAFTRTQNDLCYSYVNGRMMRDKLINHAIKQAYSEWLGSEQYPDFVLYLALDHKEVDVNVHPAKHEVRFHQGRYVHDFIYSVCHNALISVSMPTLSAEEAIAEQALERSYVTPLQAAPEPRALSAQSSYPATGSHQIRHQSSQYVSPKASDNYQRLMTPVSAPESKLTVEQPDNEQQIKLLAIVENNFGLYLKQNKLRVFHAPTLANKSNLHLLQEKWPSGLVSQPLLLPIKVVIEENNISLIEKFERLFRQSGIVLSYQQGVVIKQFPALFRSLDINDFFQQSLTFLATLSDVQQQEQTIDNHWLDFLAQYLTPKEFTVESFQLVWHQLQNQHQEDFCHYLTLNSEAIDLTSTTSQLLN